MSKKQTVREHVESELNKHGLTMDIECRNRQSQRTSEASWK